MIPRHPSFIAYHCTWQSNGSFLRATASCINSHIRQPLTGNLATCRHSTGVVINTRAIWRYHCTLVDIALPWQHNSPFFSLCQDIFSFLVIWPWQTTRGLETNWKTCFNSKPCQIPDVGLYKAYLLASSDFMYRDKGASSSTVLVMFLWCTGFGSRPCYILSKSKLLLRRFRRSLAYPLAVIMFLCHSILWVYIPCS